MPLRLAVNPDDPATEVVRRAAALLRDGGLVAFPTDTFYGLAVDPTHPAAVARLFEAKGRPPQSALPLIAADIEQARRVGRFTTLAERLAGCFWPGPLTLVVEARAGIVPAVLGGGRTIAVRVPAHLVARMLAREAGGAITATSANRSGERAPQSPDDVVRALGSWVDAVLDAGLTPGGMPSSIVDATGAAPALLREGAVPWGRVLESLE
jgi:L-threonylcarbamoyladenylate synthase